ncbi:MAG: ATP-binding protein [Salinivirgaceae bacterium]|jgi:MinD superfamily P-loop ATPase|nr:ATP-binding protein [Salinivirgaceae bacterium]
MAYKIAIASGKGGTGKTTVSVNLYHTFNNYVSNKVQLVDCDVEEPNAAIFFSGAIKDSEQIINQTIPVIDTDKCNFCKKCSEYCEFNAIAIVAGEQFAEVNVSLCHSCGACLAACDNGAIHEKELPIGSVVNYNTQFGNGLLEGRLRVGSTMQTMLIKELKKQVPNLNEVIIYDAPPGTSCPVVETVIDADFIVLVSEPTPFGLYDLKLMVELLYELKKPFGVVINKAGLGNNEIYKYLSSEQIDLLGEIPFSQDYAACYASGNLLNEMPLEISECFYKITERLKERVLLCEK